MPDKYFICPDCGKKGVYLKLLPRGEDNWRCRYCHFYFYSSPADFDDIKNYNRLLDANHLKELP